MSSAIAAHTTKPAARSGRLTANLCTNIAQLGLTMVVGVWYVPYLVSQLGPAAYGLIPLTSVITCYMTLLTAGLESAVGRFQTLSLARDELIHANLGFTVAPYATVTDTLPAGLPATGLA